MAPPSASCNCEALTPWRVRDMPPARVERELVEGLLQGKVVGSACTCEFRGCQIAFECAVKCSTQKSTLFLACRMQLAAARRRGCRGPGLRAQLPLPSTLAQYPAVGDGWHLWEPAWPSLGAEPQLRARRARGMLQPAPSPSPPCCGPAGPQPQPSARIGDAAGAGDASPATCLKLCCCSLARQAAGPQRQGVAQPAPHQCVSPSRQSPAARPSGLPQPRGVPVGRGHGCCGSSRPREPRSGPQPQRGGSFNHHQAHPLAWHRLAVGGWQSPAIAGRPSSARGPSALGGRQHAANGTARQRPQPEEDISRHQADPSAPNAAGHGLCHRPRCHGWRQQRLPIGGGSSPAAVRRRPGSSS